MNEVIADVTAAAAIQKQIEALNRKLARQNQIAAYTAAEIDRVQKRQEVAPSAPLEILVQSLDTKLKRQLRATAMTAAYIELLSASDADMKVVATKLASKKR